MPHSPSAEVRKLSNFIRLSPGELACLMQLQSARENVPASIDLVHEGQAGHRAFVLQEGWA
jgi:hypothetical protein